MFSYKLICITTQKIQSQTTPKLFYKARRNKSRQKVCPSLYITSVHVHQWHQTTSHSFAVLHVHDHNWKSAGFSWVFRCQNDFHEEFLFILCFFALVNKERFRRKRSCKFSPPSWILSHGQQVSSLFPGGHLVKKMLQVLHIWIIFDRAAVKQQT